MSLKSFAIARKKLLAAERGRIPGKPSILQVALGFPNVYEVGISNLGYQTIYRLLNRMKQVSCERFFLFDFPADGGTRTLESDRDIKRFDIVAFSIPFELDYPNALRLLKFSGIPLLSSSRKAGTPLVIAGGIAPTLNPEILAPFVDCVLVGEAEDVLAEFMDEYSRLRSLKVSKENVLLELSRIEGVYVPTLYRVDYGEDGAVKAIEIKKGAPSAVKRRSVNLEGIETFSPIVSPYAHFKNFLLLEAGRGCARGCRFCAAGHVYGPCRFYAGESVLSQVEKYAVQVRHVGLIGSLISDHPELERICETLSSKGFEIGTSSLRVDTIGPKLLKTLVDSGLRTLTIAPEVGTERMWKVIKKNIDKKAVLKSAKLACEALIPNLKLYFMVGLPFEREEDIDGIIDLVHQVHGVFIRGCRPRGGKKQALPRLRISINPFIPKPHTPFQWCGMNQKKELKRKLSKIAGGLRSLKGVHFERKSVRQAALQGLLSLGNRRVGEALLYAIEENLTFDQAWKKAGLRPNRIVFDPKSLESRFPWDIVDTGVSKEYLMGEFEKARMAAGE